MLVTALEVPRRWLFGPVDARVVGWMRATLGVALVASHLAYAPELDALFGPDALLTQGLFRTDTQWLAWYRLVPDATGLPWLHGALLLPAVAVLVGVGGRTSLVLALLAQLALMHSNGLTQNGGDRLLRMWTLCMLGSDGTAAVSVDAWWARRRGRRPPAVVSGLAVRLVQLQLAWMYCSTGLAKLGGAPWRGGDALYYALLAEHFQRVCGALSPARLGAGLALWITRLGTWSVLAWEVGFPLLVLWRRTRWLALALGVIFHLGIFAAMMVGTFSLVSLWGYLAFVLPALPSLRETDPAIIPVTATPPGPPASAPAG